jgi:hypothetical protein
MAPPASVISVYPPLKKARLHDLNGNVLRTNAEKSFYINEFLLDLFTQENDWVLDLFAGTASLGMACLKTNRLYNGFEIESELYFHATLRLARAMEIFERKAVLKTQLSQPGLVSGLLQQVSFLVSCLFLVVVYYLLENKKNDLLCRSAELRGPSLPKTCQPGNMLGVPSYR